MIYVLSAALLVLGGLTVVALDVIKNKHFPSLEATVYMITVWNYAGISPVLHGQDKMVVGIGALIILSLMSVFCWQRWRKLSRSQKSSSAGG